MQIYFKPETGSIGIIFGPYESDRSAILMQLIFEEEKKKGVLVPEMPKNFFIDMAGTRHKFGVEFGFKHLGPVITFLEESCYDMTARDIDPTKIVRTLDNIGQWRCGEDWIGTTTIH